MFKPYYKLRSDKISARGLSAFTPIQLASLYNFPTGDGTGQKIGIIELGGGYILNDIITYFAQLGISGTPNITPVSVDGVVNNPSDTSGANYEVILDIEVIAAIVPRAAIFVYFAPNSTQGFYNGINRAITDGCNVISISWGAHENGWGGSSVIRQYDSLFATAVAAGISIFCASGDNGSSDGAPGNNVDFPASSPNVIGCGGTTLSATANSIDNEVSWNNNTGATGGGISKIFTKPTYQNIVAYSLSGRGVPDICGDADPNTGYTLYYRGSNIVIGGTSAVSPLWAALTARCNQNLAAAGKALAGFYLPLIYNNAVCRDIVSGNNGAFTAGAAWDPCTGLGSPNGTALLNLLIANRGNTPTPTPPPNGAPTASFTALPVGGNTPLTVTFTNTSTNSPVSYLWDFGDGTTSTAANPTHVYTNSTPASTTTYTVSLTATNNGGNNTVTKNSYITVTNTATLPITKPIASFTANPVKGRRPLVVKFTNQSTGGGLMKYLWTFGDGTTSKVAAPSHTYINAGKYTVTVKVTNQAGSNIATKSSYIHVL